MKRISNKIMLIEPPFYRLYKPTYSMDRYPLSLGYLAGAIRSNTDWKVKVYNADFSPASEATKVSYMAGEGFRNYLNKLKIPDGPVWQEISRTIQSHRPAVVGLSAKSQNFASTVRIAGLAKELDPAMTVILGGPHAAMVGAEVLEKCRDIDIAVYGEGETTLVECLHALEQGKPLDDIAGIYHRWNHQIVQEKPRSYIDDLDRLPFPHVDAPDVLVNFADYPLSAFQHIFTQRGCPFNCFFCGSRNIWSRQVRFRSIENIIQEIQSLQSWGLNRIHFDDDTFGVSKKRIFKLCQALQSQCPELRWSCELHVNLVDEAILSAMKAAGCYSIQVGIESGNNQILRAMRKHTTIEKALAACREIKRQDMIVQAFFIVGFPQETEQTLQDTVRAMQDASLDYVLYSIFTPYPGTEAYEFCRQEGLISDDFDVSLYNHQSPANCFCRHIPPERFRLLLKQIEKMVDHRNYMTSLKRNVAKNPLTHIRRHGLRGSLQKGLKVIAGK